MKSKPHILDYDPGEWEEYVQKIGEKKYRAGQIFEWLHSKSVLNVDQFSNIPDSLKEKLKEDFYTELGKIKSKTESLDGTVKILIELSGSRFIEAVLLKNGPRITVCASTQAGCSLYCGFCMTAKGKFMGNLSTGEILEQIYVFKSLSEERISNIVFMGMGEPFMNYDSTLKAAHMLNNHKGMNIGVRKITVSTAGVLPALKKFIETGEPFNLALSVHSMDPIIRKSLMDSEKKWPLEDILEYLEKSRFQRPKNKVTFEYIMISGLNMSKSDVGLLAKATKRVGAKISLIPLNFEFDDYKRPAFEEINEFWQEIKDQGVEVFNRASQGYDILAACGMLRYNEQ
jgi:23S rRNA (adenine2503-C2)-methyltransferase